jgi:hypothetical protein
MQTIIERMALVGEVANRVGVRALAYEAGLSPSTVRSYALRGWRHKYIQVCDRLIEAAERLSHNPPISKPQPHISLRPSPRRASKTLATPEAIKSFWDGR